MKVKEWLFLGSLFLLSSVKSRSELVILRTDFTCNFPHMLSCRRSWCLLPRWQVISGQQFSLKTLSRFFFPAIDIIFAIWSCRSYVNCGRDVSLRKVLRTIPWLGDLWNVLYPCPMFMFIMLRKVARLLNHVQMSLRRQLLLSP